MVLVPDGTLHGVHPDDVRRVSEEISRVWHAADYRIIESAMGQTGADAVAAARVDEVQPAPEAAPEEDPRLTKFRADYGK